MELGVDGFEIANFGHPELTEDTREALLSVQTARGVALLGNSDWHGWSGFTRTWTVVKPANAAGSRAEQVISALRARDAGHIIPIVSQMIVTPSVLRRIFAPAAEIARYTAELSLARLMSWWGWAIVLVWLAARLWRADVSPGRFFLGIGLFVLAGPITVRAAELGTRIAHRRAAFLYLAVAAVGGGAGIVALAIAAIIAHEIIGRNGSASRDGCAEYGPCGLAVRRQEVARRDRLRRPPGSVARRALTHRSGTRAPVESARFVRPEQPGSAK